MFLYEEKQDKETLRGELLVKTEVKTGGVFTCQRGSVIAGNYWNLGEGCGTDSPSEPPEGTNPTHTLISDFWPPNRQLLKTVRKFLFLQPPSVIIIFVMASLGI